jgi:hypothetical protein
MSIPFMPTCSVENSPVLVLPVQFVFSRCCSRRFAKQHHHTHIYFLSLSLYVCVSFILRGCVPSVLHEVRKKTSLFHFSFFAPLIVRSAFIQLHLYQGCELEPDAPMCGHRKLHNTRTNTGSNNEAGQHYIGANAANSGANTDVDSCADAGANAGRQYIGADSDHRRPDRAGDDVRADSASDTEAVLLL